jgi:hypothetical protein
MYPRPPQCSSIMTFGLLRSAFTVTVVVTVTGIDTMPVR